MTDSTDNARGPDLLPCPFCGGDDIQWVIGGTGCAYVSCKTCPAETGDGSIPRIAAAWNRRADLAPDPLGAVKVKPLEWYQIETHGGTVWDAIAIHTVYRIILKADGQYWLTEPDLTLFTLKAAKAAAGVHNTVRVKSALEPPALSPTGGNADG